MSTDSDIDSLVAQLQGVSKTVNEVRNTSENYPVVTKENLETFVIDKASRLINESADTISYLRRLVEAAPDAKEVEALASLINASTSAIDTLSKMVVSEKKNNTLKEIKQLDLVAKTKTEEIKQVKYTREEIFKQLFKNEPKEAEIVDIPTQQG